MTEQVSFMQRVLKSFLFFGAGNASTRVLNAIALIYALKELSQADLGLATLVMAILAIVQAATELGLGAAVVQRKELSREQLDSLFWVGLVLSCAVYGVIALSAPLAARFYDSPELSPMLMVYGSAIVISALFVVPRSLMVRDLHFGRLAVIDLASGRISVVSNDMDRDAGLWDVSAGLDDGSARVWTGGFWSDVITLDRNPGASTQD